jgi:hypothetical protein
MVLQVASIIFNDSASQFNKDLTDFLRRNLETAIRKGRMTFVYRVAGAADLAELRAQGIKRLPAMTLANQTFIGVPDIIDEIRRRVKTSKSEAIEKSEDEIVRDYQMKALGDIKKDADGKFVINDEPEDNDDARLRADFQREIERRGSSIGHDDKGGGTAERRLAKDPPPRPPARAREVDRDDDDYDDRAPPKQQRQQHMPAMPAMTQRVDNLANPGMGDALASLQRIGRHATGDDAKDDALMARLLERMGGD